MVRLFLIIHDALKISCESVRISYKKQMLNSLGKLVMKEVRKKASPFSFWDFLIALKKIWMISDKYISLILCMPFLVLGSNKLYLFSFFHSIQWGGRVLRIQKQ